MIAIVDNELTVKRLLKKGSSIQLVPENPDYPVMTFKSDMELTVWGVVTGAVRRF